MAIYHFSAQMIKRSDGRSATAASAYRAGQQIADRTTGEVWDFTRKGGVYGSSILAPSHAPSWVSDRSELWNQVEEVERRRDAQLAREIDLAIPKELNNLDRIELVREYVQEQFVDQGMIADVCFHDFESHNPHAHIMLTTREITSEGFGKKQRAWNEHSLMPRWREKWSMHANRALEASGFTSRIDHRSYEAQGVDLIPTKHMGPSAAGMERKGIETRVGDINRRTDNANSRFMDNEVELAVQRLEVTAEIERIRREALSQPSTSGTIEIGQANSDIADRAEKEASRYKTGIAASLGDQYKAKLFLETWQFDLAPSIFKTLRWVDVDSRALTLKTGEQIRDKGDAVSLSKGSDDAIQVAIAMARSKGWESVRVTGSDDFQVRAALALTDAGIEPSLTSDIAQSRFGDELHKRWAPSAESVPEPQPTPAHDPAPESSEPASVPQPDPESEIDINALKDLVRRVAAQAPPPQTSTYRDDTRKLKQWARDRWNALVAEGEPDGLRAAFIDVIEEQALMAGYSAFEIEAVQQAGSWKKAIEGTSQPPDPTPRPALRQRRTGYPGEGNKFPGT